MIYINNPVQQTWIVTILLGVALALSLRKRKDKELFPVSVTQELKGLAILFIIFAHIGYSLSSSSQFLWPLSNLAGVGVNIFLFVSGYGLTSSALKKPLSIKQFYSRRLKKLFIPFWLIITIYFLADYFFLSRSYPVEYMAKAFGGIFQTADVIKDLDSPLWYFSLILFYYLIYPLVFIKKRPWISALIIFAVTYFLIHHSFIGKYDNIHLYKVYTAAFPLGIIAAWLHSNKDKISLYLNNFSNSITSYRPGKMMRRSFSYILIVGLLAAVIYSRAYSSPWDSPLKEQTVNLLTVFALLLLFMIKRLDMKLLYIFGVYSYEIYLIHWPLISRYDIIFKHTKPWLGVILYLAIFILLAWVFSKLVSFVENYPRKSASQ